MTYFMELVRRLVPDELLLHARRSLEAINGQRKPGPASLTEKYLCFCSWCCSSIDSWKARMVYLKWRKSHVKLRCYRTVKKHGEENGLDPELMELGIEQDMPGVGVGEFLDALNELICMQNFEDPQWGGLDIIGATMLPVAEEINSDNGSYEDGFVADAHPIEDVCLAEGIDLEIDVHCRGLIDKVGEENLDVGAIPVLNLVRQSQRVRNPPTHLAGFVSGSRKRRLDDRPSEIVDAGGVMPDKDEQPVEHDPILKKFREGQSLTEEERECLRERRMGNDGAEIKALRGYEAILPESILQILSSYITLKHNSAISEDNIKVALQQAKQGFTSLFGEEAKSAPTNWADLKGLLLSKHAPPVYRYKMCKCGQVQRCEHRDKSKCPDCNIPWDRNLNIFSIINHAIALFSIPEVAAALKHREPDHDVLDIVDTDMWRDIVTNDVVIGEDNRHLKIVLFYDGVLMSASNRSGGSLAVCLAALYNLPPHLRWLEGFMLPLFTFHSSERPNCLRYVQQVVADEIRLLWICGVNVTDASDSNREFKLRGKLLTVLLDSMEWREFLGFNQAGSLVCCNRCSFQGFTPRVMGSTLTKVIYLEHYKYLDTKGDPALEKLKRANAHLNHQGSQAPLKRHTKHELEEAYISLYSGGDSDTIQLSACDQLGVNSYCPLFTCGLQLQHVVPDSMHSIANVIKNMRQTITGKGGLLKSACPEEWLRYEGQVIRRDFRRECGPPKFQWTPHELELVQKRCRLLKQKRYINDLYAEKGVLEAFEFDSMGNLLGMKSHACHMWASPFGKYIFTGTLQEKITTTISDDEQFTISPEEAIFAMLDALNFIREKTFIRADIEAAPQMMSVALCKLAMALPSFNFNYIYHQVLEAATALPCHATAAWGCETYNRTERVMATRNYRRPDATVAVQVQAKTAENNFLLRNHQLKIPACPPKTVYNLSMDRRIILRKATNAPALSDDQKAQLLDYYSLHAPGLRELLTMFEEDGGQSILAERSPRKKLHIWEEAKRWFDMVTPWRDARKPWWDRRRLRGELEFDKWRYLDIDWTYKRYMKCAIGPLQLHSRECDRSKTRSLFLSEVWNEVDGQLQLSYKVARAYGFLEVKQPGSTTEKLVFIDRRVLIQPEPSKTVRSGLPLVIMDNSFNGPYDFSAHSLWAATSVDPTDIFIAPVDALYDLPRTSEGVYHIESTETVKHVFSESKLDGIRKQYKEGSRQRLLGSEAGNAGQVLGVVICPYNSKNEYFK